MKYKFSVYSLIVMAFTLPNAFAGEQNVTLSVEKMTCVSCPYMVKKSLENVSGIKKVSVSLESKTATIVYDDEVASVDQLIATTTEIGYPSKVIE